MSFNRSGYIGRAPGDSAVTIARKSYEPTGVQTDFTFSAGYVNGYCDVYLNGVKLVNEKDYTATNGSTVGLTSAANNGDIVEVVAYKAFNLGVPLSDITGDLSITGSVSASSSITANNGTGEIHGAFVGDGSGLTGVASTDYIITGTAATFNSQVKVLNLNVTGITSTTSFNVGSATTIDGGGINVTGVITGTTFSGNLTGDVTGGISGGTVAGSTGTFSGAVNVDDTTDSTSVSTGALIVDGGVGIAKNVYIGAGLSVAGTLTYEDVTNVDSVGLITAKSGVNVTGGQLQVGVAYSVGAAGVATAAGFVGGTIAGSTGSFTGDVDIADKIVHTGDTNTAIRFPSADTITLETGGTERARVTSDGEFLVGTTTDNGFKFKVSDGGASEFAFSPNDSGVNSLVNYDRVGAAYTNFKLTAREQQFWSGAVPAERLRITSDGGVGINTTNPSGKLGVAVDNSSTNTLATGGEALTLKNTNTTDDTWVSVDFNNSAGGIVGRFGAQFKDTSDKDTDLYFATRADGGSLTEKLRIKSDGDIDIYGTASGVSSVTWDASANSLIFKDGSRAKFGDGSDLHVYHNGSNSVIREEGTGNLNIQTTGGNVDILVNTTETAAKFISDGAVELYHKDSKKFETTNDGVVITGIATCSAGLNVDGLLSEKFNTLAGKLSDNPNIDLQDGMIWYFTTQESTTATPNIRQNASKTLNNMLSTGDAITVTIITTAGSNGYSPNWQIDGSNITEEWIGGEAPSEGGSDGYDIYTANILKTANATFKVFINLVNAT